MPKLSDINENVRSGILLAVSIIAATLTSVIILALEITAPATVEIHSPPPVIGFVKSASFIAFAVIYWNVFSRIEPSLVEKYLWLKPIDILLLLILTLNFIYAVTLFLPAVPIPDFQSPVPTSTFLEPIVLTILGVMAIVFQEKKANRQKESVENRNPAFWIPYLMTSPLLFAKDEADVNYCDFCGEVLGQNDSVYEHIYKSDDDQKQIQVNQFCSTVCVVTFEQQKSQ